MFPLTDPFCSMLVQVAAYAQRLELRKWPVFLPAEPDPMVAVFLDWCQHTAVGQATRKQMPLYRDALFRGLLQWLRIQRALVQWNRLSGKEQQYAAGVWIAWRLLEMQGSVALNHGLRWNSEGLTPDQRLLCAQVVHSWTLLHMHHIYGTHQNEGAFLFSLQWPTASVAAVTQSKGLEQEATQIWSLARGAVHYACAYDRFLLEYQS